MLQHSAMSEQAVRSERVNRALSPLVGIVILNTNRRLDTLECLRSIAASTFQNLLIWVLDNASTDGSVQAIENEFPSVHIVRLASNKGYAGNNNVGIHIALENGADWVLVLNEDTVLAPDCIQRMVEAGESGPNVGMVGPMVYHADEPGYIQSAGGQLDRLWRATHLGKNELDIHQFCGNRLVDWISGCALMVRGQTLEQIGLIDERFFYYWEETDWCVRAKQAGWQLVLVAEAKLWHKGVQRVYQPNPRVTYFNARNRLLFLDKNGAPVAAKALAWFQSLRTLASWSIRPKWKSQVEHRQALQRGLLDYLGRRWGPAPL